MDGKFEYLDSYYNQLLTFIENYNLVLTKKEYIKYSTRFQKYFDKVNIDKKLLLLSHEEFGIRIEKIVNINCMKYILLAKSFNDEINIDNIRAAVYFTTLGCILDNIIDFNINDKRSIAENKLSWKYCKDYFLNSSNIKDNSVIDILLCKIGKNFDDMRIYDKALSDYIVDNIKKSILSEEFVSNRCRYNVEENIDFEKISNKSILFTYVGIKIALFNVRDTKRVDKAAYAVGEIFMIIDDMCDIYEDMCRNQFNSVFMFNNQSSTDNIIEIAAKNMPNLFEKLSNQFNIVMKNTSKDFYNFLLFEIKDWIYGSKILRDKIKGIR